MWQKCFIESFYSTWNRTLAREVFAKMSHHSHHQQHHPTQFLINNKAEIGFVEIKSKFDAEFRRFSLDGSKVATFEAFHDLLSQVHLLGGDQQQQRDGNLTFHVFYVDPKDNDLLPITNTDNYRRALQSARPLLRLVIQRHGECEENYYRRTVAGGMGGSSLLTSMLGGTPKPHKTVIPISKPTEFRQVSFNSARPVFNLP